MYFQCNQDLVILINWKIQKSCVTTLGHTTFVLGSIHISRGQKVLGDSAVWIQILFESPRFKKNI